MEQGYDDIFGGIAFPLFKKYGNTRFTVYTTTNEGKTYSYSCDLSKDEQIKEHNNLYIQMDVFDAKPDGSGYPGMRPIQKSRMSQVNRMILIFLEEPDVPEVPVSAPTIKVDISLVERNYIIVNTF